MHVYLLCLFYNITEVYMLGWAGLRALSGVSDHFTTSQYIHQLNIEVIGAYLKMEGKLTFMKWLSVWYCNIYNLFYVIVICHSDTGEFVKISSL